MTHSVIASLHSSFEIPGYTTVEQLYLGSRTAVYRAVQTAQQSPVVIKVLRREYPSFGELVQFRNQYTIAKNLPIPGIIQPLSLEPLGSGYALVMEDFGGIALSTYIQQQVVKLTEGLAIALQIADILHDLAQHRVVHKDIKPANILIHPESKQIKLIDFSIASLLPKENQAIQSPNTLEGTLAYLAPEQTGRMNRAIDYRTDFYAFGVTLYHLLTGTLPFVSDDPLELMHCHMAKTPIPIDQVKSDIPPIVAAIVTKLMAKNAEDRYQSALGLKHDLEQCLTQWQATGTIADFPLGQRDLSNRFVIPEKLYGREAEVQTLLNAFDRVAVGSSELMLVAGFSGIGKTAVVSEVHKPIARLRGYFIKGKFDQFNRNVPLSAFVQALRELMEQLLSESDSQLAQWRAKILTAVGENGQVLIDVIPELEQIIGKQPNLADLSGNAAQNRFNLLFQKFIEVFTTAEHPLVIFLDDLQWTDTASLQLIKLLIADNGYLLILGAYRDNEVSPAHPFILTVEELKKAKAIVNTITLKPLTFDHTNHLVADTLKCSLELAQPITELIDRKTKGNPFFTTQFLKALHEEGQIRFNCDRCYWECDIAQVNALSLTDDIVEFMALQLQKLPVETQQLLQLAACIGNQFDLATLAIVSEQSPTDTAVALWKALQEGSILPTNQVYKFFQSEQIESPNSDTQNGVNPKYRFLHDRVQQAAYSLIPETQKQATHYRLGKLLWRDLSSAERDERIFDVVNQINLGQALINDEGEKQRLAELNLKAGQKAKAATAYGAAKSYFQVGINLLTHNAWMTTYRLVFDLHFNLAEAELTSGDFQSLEQTVSTLLKFANSGVDQAQIYVLKVDQHSLQGQFSAAIEAGLTGLRNLGIDINQETLRQLAQDEFAIVANRLENRVIAQLLDTPIATNPEVQAAIQLLIILQPPAYIVSNFDLYSFATFRAVRLSVEQGNTAESIKAYASYGFLIGLMYGQYQRGLEFADLALRLSYKLNDKFQQSRACFMSGTAIQVWAKPIQGAAEVNYQGFLAGLESGEIIHAGYNLYGNILNRLFQGENLADIMTDIDKYWLIGEKLQHDFLLSILAACRFFTHPLSYHLDEANTLATAEQDWIERSKSSKSYTALGTYYILKMHWACLIQSDKSNIHYVREARKFLDACAGFTTSAGYYYYSSLLLLNGSPDVAEAERCDVLQQVEANQAKLKIWSESCSENFLHKYLLVEAERSRISGQYPDAIIFYDRAIAEAKANGYLQEEALANELTAKFYLNWGKEKVAAGYMQEAYYCYSRWGAKAKTEDLEHRYPHLLQPILQQAIHIFNPLETLATIADSSFSVDSSTSSHHSFSNNTILDFATILKASQAISGTIQLDDLLRQLTQIILQNSGGDRCALMLPNEHGEWQVRAIATSETTELCSEALDNQPSLPVQLIHYVKNTQKVVVIDDCQTDLPLIDEYLNQHRPKSVLCLPILNQGHLLGILYLKNRLTAGTFTSDRILVINFLCTQAAISLENARHYQRAQDYAQKLEHSLEQLRVSETRFQKLADNLPGLIYRIQIEPDGSSSMPYVSSGCQALYEVAAEDLMSGKYSLRDFEHPDDQAEAFQAVVESAQMLTPFRHEWRIITPNGAMKWVQAASQPERTEDGKIVWDGLVIDITDRKRIEAERQQAETTMRLSEERYRSLITVSSQIVWIATPDGLSVESPNWCAYTGQSLDKLKNFGWLEALHPDDIDYVGRVWNHARETKSFYKVEYRIRAADGTYRYFDVQGVPILAEDGSIREWIGACADIDERKRVENALIQKSEELTQALQNLQSTQLQMVQSEKMASLGNLVAGVAHEINNPIGFLNGSINNAKDYVQDLLGHLALYQQHHPNPATPVQDNAEDIDLEFLSEDLPKVLDSMKGATDRIKSISTSLRTFSRADAENKVSANLHEGLDSTLLILKYRLKANEHRPAIQVIQEYGDLPLVECFPGQLNQVFMNILANAIDVFDEAAQHTSFADLQTHPQQITIQTTLVEHNTAEIRISDNGKGMSEDVKSRIFDHLFTTKSVGKGTGLGLAIAQQIVVEKHEGIIEVYSTLGKGAEFVIYLPIKRIGA